MDIDLFSEIVKGLILDNDEVALPGLGTFVSELMPSTFSDKGYTINPPYRKLSFRHRETGDGRLLTDFYSRVNGTDPAISERILSEFISGLRATLQAKKIVVFPGLGRLRATKENAFFFIADEDLDIYPYGVCLEPVSLKTHEETPEEVAQSVAALRELVDSPMDRHRQAKEPALRPSGEIAVPQDPEVVTEGAGNEALRPSGEIAVPQDPDEEEGKVTKTGRSGLRAAAIVVASVVGLAAVALGIVILLSHVAPDLIDSILYTQEELSIINY